MAKTLNSSIRPKLSDVKLYVEVQSTYQEMLCHSRKLKHKFGLVWFVLRPCKHDIV